MGVSSRAKLGWLQVLCLFLKISKTSNSFLLCFQLGSAPFLPSLKNHSPSKTPKTSQEKSPSPCGRPFFHLFLFPRIRPSPYIYKILLKYPLLLPPTVEFSFPFLNYLISLSKIALISSKDPYMAGTSLENSTFPSESFSFQPSVREYHCPPSAAMDFPFVKFW